MTKTGNIGMTGFFTGVETSMTMTSIQVLSLDIMDEESTGLSTRVIGYRKPQEMQEGIGKSKEICFSPPCTGNQSQGPYEGRFMVTWDI